MSRFFALNLRKTIIMGKFFQILQIQSVFSQVLNLGPELGNPDFKKETVDSLSQKTSWKPTTTNAWRLLTTKSRGR